MPALRTLMLCPYVPEPLRHGGRIRSRLFAQTMADLGEVQLAVAVENDEHREDAARLRRVFSGPVHELPAAPPQQVRPAAKLRRWLRARSDVFERRWPPAAHRLVAELLQRERFDLLFADASFVLPLVPRRLTPRLLLNLHNVESHLLARPGAADFKARLSGRVEAQFAARLERWAATHATLTVAISDLDARRLLALAPRARVGVVENSVDLDAIPQLPPTPAGEPPLLIYVGGYDYPPNREAAVCLLSSHLPALRQRFPNLRVRLIGHDPSGEIGAHARRVGAEAVGRVDDLRPHYLAATAVYLPILTGGGTRAKILDAFAFGRPVLASTLGAEGFELEPGIHYLSVDTPAQGVEALARVIAGEGADFVKRSRALLEQRWTHKVAAGRLKELVVRHFG